MVINHLLTGMILQEPPSSSTPQPIPHVPEHVWPHFATPRPPPTRSQVPGGGSMLLPVNRA